MRSALTLRIAAAGVAIAVGAVGCSQTRQYQPPVDPQTLTDIEFLHYLEQVPVVTFEEGCRGIAMLAEGQDPHDSHAARYEALRAQGIVRDAWKLDAADTLDLGTLAFMAAEAVDLPPSVDSVLLGSWGLGDRRYALRRAVEHGIVGYGPTYKPVTGEEMVAALHHLDGYLAKRQEYGTGGTVPEEPGNVPTGGARPATTARSTGGN
jgi:hypothetical protein